MKFALASILALTATTAAADWQCGTTQTQYWETNYIRVIETRDCTGQLVNWERIDSTPSHKRQQIHAVTTRNQDRTGALIFGIILGSVLSK